MRGNRQIDRTLAPILKDIRKHITSLELDSMDLNSLRPGAIRGLTHIRDTLENFKLGNV